MEPKSALLLESIAAEIEAFAGTYGWDGPPILFALVPTRTLAADPAAADVIGMAAAPEISPDALTPIAQEDLPEGPLDEVLAQIGWPDEVSGCALSQHILMLPPTAEAEVTGLDADTAAAHPDRREARLVVAVLRTGASASLLRLRAPDGEASDLLTGSELAPNLAAALLATLAD